MRDSFKDKIFFQLFLLIIAGAIFVLVTFFLFFYHSGPSVEGSNRVKFGVYVALWTSATDVETSTKDDYVTTAGRFDLDWMSSTTNEVDFYYPDYSPAWGYQKDKNNYIKNASWAQYGYNYPIGSYARYLVIKPYNNYIYEASCFGVTDSLSNSYARTASTAIRYYSNGTFYSSESAANSAKTSVWADTFYKIYINYRQRYDLAYYSSTNLSTDSVAFDYADIYAGIGFNTKDSYYNGGYHVASWYRFGSNNTFYQPGSYIPDEDVNESIALCAMWEPNTYTVRYHSGKENTASTYTQTFKYSEYKNLLGDPWPNLKPGYHITRWEKDSVVGYSSTESVGNLTTQDGGVIDLYAIWEPNSYTVRFNAKGGSGSMSNQSFIYDVSQALTKNSFTAQTGKYFAGWDTSSSGTNVVYTNQQTVSKLSSTQGAVVDLYAVWRSEKYKFELHGNGGKFKESQTDFSSRNYELGYLDSQEIEIYRVGYNFSGFSKTTTGNVAYGFSNGFLSNGSSTNKYKFKVNQDFGNDGDNVPLYAIWTPITYTINFDKNNVSTTGVSISPTGTPSPSLIPATYDTGVTLSVTGVSCVGYDLVGWGTTESGGTESGGTVYKNGDTLKNLSSTQGETVTLYAQWQAKEYTITFNANGKKLMPGSGDITSQKKTYEQSLKMPNVSSLGYIFIGWLYNSKYFNADTTYTLKSITSGKEDNKSIEFVAQWQDTWANHVEQPTFVSGNYEVTKPAHLGWIAQQLQSTGNNTLSSYTFVQKGNIDLNGYPWLSEGTFSGTYNGNGYHIYNLKTTDNANVVKSDYEGLFAQTSNAVLTNISIMSGSLSGKSYVGALVGKASNTIIRNCINYASVSGTDNVGGLIGRKEESNKTNASLTISGCVNYGKVTSSGSYTGGLVGYISNSTINGCYVRANVTGGSNSGGIIGYGSNVTITGSAFVGSVNSASSYGIAGYISGTVTDCLIDTGTIAIASSPFPSGATNCIAYGNGSNTTTSTMSYANWIQLNGKWFPKGLTWAA